MQFKKKGEKKKTPFLIHWEMKGTKQFIKKKKGSKQRALGM